MYILIVGIILAIVLVTSFVIVAFDPDEHGRLKELARAFVPTLIALPFVAGAWWVFESGFEPLGGLGTELRDEAWRRSNEPSISFLWPWLLSPLAGLADILITLGLLGGAAVTVLAAVRFLIPVFPSIVALPVIAVRQGFYFFSQPLSVRKVKGVTRASDAHVEDIHEAGKVLRKEAEAAHPFNPKKMSSATLRAQARHYHEAADRIREKMSGLLSTKKAKAYREHNEAVGRVADKLREYQEVLHRERRGRDERQD